MQRAKGKDGQREGAEKGGGAGVVKPKIYEKTLRKSDTW